MYQDTLSLQAAIEIYTLPTYLEAHSSPEQGEYAFAYTVDIVNTGIETVQLLSRHWIITDGNNDIREVKGDGVIGKQPFIEPQSSHRYSSGAILGTRVGTMEGSYTMRSVGGIEFEVTIPVFALIAPGALQ